MPDPVSDIIPSSRHFAIAGYRVALPVATEGEPVSLNHLFDLDGIAR